MTFRKRVRNAIVNNKYTRRALMGLAPYIGSRRTQKINRSSTASAPEIPRKSSIRSRSSRSRSLSSIDLVDKETPMTAAINKGKREFVLNLSENDIYKNKDNISKLMSYKTQIQNALIQLNKEKTEHLKNKLKRHSNSSNRRSSARVSAETDTDEKIMRLKEKLDIIESFMQKRSSSRRRSSRRSESGDDEQIYDAFLKGRVSE